MALVALSALILMHAPLAVVVGPPAPSPRFIAAARRHGHWSRPQAVVSARQGSTIPLAAIEWQGVRQVRGRSGCVLCCAMLCCVPCGAVPYHTTAEARLTLRNASYSAALEGVPKPSVRMAHWRSRAIQATDVNRPQRDCKHRLLPCKRNEWEITPFLKCRCAQISTSPKLPFTYFLSSAESGF